MHCNLRGRSKTSGELQMLVNQYQHGDLRCFSLRGMSTERTAEVRRIIFLLQLTKRFFQLKHFLVNLMDRPGSLPLSSPITNGWAVT